MSTSTAAAAAFEKSELQFHFKKRKNNLASRKAAAPTDSSSLQLFLFSIEERVQLNWLPTNHGMELSQERKKGFSQRTKRIY